MAEELTLDEAKEELRRAEEGLSELINLRAAAPGGLGLANASIATREASIRQLRELVQHFSR